MGLPNGQIAKNFAQLLKFQGGEKAQTLTCYEVQTQTFWQYQAGVWLAKNREDIHAEVRRFCMMTEATATLTMGKIRDITDQLTFEVDRHDVLKDGWIAFEDGSWNPDTNEFADHAPERFATIKVKALYNNLPKPEDAPIFHKFLSEVCVDEELKPLPGMKDLLQEMFGYCLMASSERAVSFFLTGRGRNGKGVLSGILQEIMGAERVSNMALEDLTTDRFASSALVGKRLNIADETNTHRDAASSMFKKLVAVDNVQAQRKFEGSFSFKPRCKYIFLVNGIPTFDGFDYALRERIIPIPFFRSFSEEERDYTLKARIIAGELPAVVAWAMEGLRRLQERNLRFTITEQSRDCLNQFEDASSSLAEFFNEGWEISDTAYPARDFYVEFVEWTKKTGRKQMSSNRVSREMIDKTGKGKRVWHAASGFSVPGLMIRRRKTKEENMTLDI
jgi:putative DNA primase/helicase